MDLPAAFRVRLLANSNVNSLSGGKIAWDERTALPAVVLTKVGPGQSWTHDGPNALIEPRVQVDCYGDTRASAQALANAVQAEMQRLDTVTAGGWLFMPPGTLNVDLSREPEDLPGGGKAYLVIHEYSFWAQPAE